MRAIIRATSAFNLRMRQCKSEFGLTSLGLIQKKWKKDLQEEFLGIPLGFRKILGKLFCFSKMRNMHASCSWCWLFSLPGSLSLESSHKTQFSCPNDCSMLKSWNFPDADAARLWQVTFVFVLSKMCVSHEMYTTRGSWNADAKTTQFSKRQYVDFVGLGHYAIIITKTERAALLGMQKI